jgi:predicted DNA-binding transcriptional regulator
MVSKFKKEHEGLLPEYFSLPGEENEEKEREYPEELLDYYQLKEQLKPIEEKLRDDEIRKAAIDDIRINFWPRELDVFSISHVFVRYSALLYYPRFDEIKKDYLKDIDVIEKKLENEVINLIISRILFDIFDIIEGKTQQWKIALGFYDSFDNYAALIRYFKFHAIKEEYKKDINQIEKGLRNEKVRKIWIKRIYTRVREGQQEEVNVSDSKPASDAFLGYISLLSYPEFYEIKSQFLKEIEKIEKGLKNETIRRNIIKEIFYEIQAFKLNAVDAFLGYTTLLSYLNYLYTVGQKKLGEIESQKAMHPELRKNLPPIPEERMF